MSKFKFFCLALALSCAVPGLAAPTPTTVEELYAHLQKQNPKGKAEVLAALPEELKKNFVLVRKSRSRQRGSATLPRVVNFSKTTDLVVTSSGHSPDDDFAANDLEVMEFDRKTGKWIFSAIQFDDTGLKAMHKDVMMCSRCHGVDPRPIWGDHGRWPFAFGGSMTEPEKMEGQELADFLAWEKTASTHEAYRHLEFKTLADRFQLVDTQYSLPNSTFTARLGVLTGVALHLRAKSSPDYEKNSAVFALKTLACTIPSSVAKRVDQDYEQRIKNDPSFASRWTGVVKPQDTASLALRLLDLDPTVDFELADVAAIAARRDTFDMQNPWSIGTDSLPSLLTFRFFHEIYERETSVRTAFAPVRGSIEFLAKESFGATNESLEALDAASTGTEYSKTLFPSLETTVWRDAALKKAACDAFTKRAL